MRVRVLLPLGLLIAVGCLVPHYGVDEPGAGSGSGPDTSGMSGSKANSASGTSNGGSGSDTAGSGSDAAGSGSTPIGGAVGLTCAAQQKVCGGACVDIDDVKYGCTDTSCNMSGCPIVTGSATLACDAGACVIGTCDTGSKKCDGKCVALNDPTYGCGATSCDAKTCPDPKSGTLVCNGATCAVGTCGPSTKACANRCVPLDANNGCSDPKDCNPCESYESCIGAPAVCGCTPDNAEACKGLACGSATNNCHKAVTCVDTCVAPNVCGHDANNLNQCVCYPDDPCSALSCGTAVNSCKQSVTCTSKCVAPTPSCSGNTCVECNAATDCPGPQGNPCAKATCNSHKCGFTTVAAGTICAGGGTCSTTLAGVCTRAAIDAGGVSIDATEVTRGQYAAFYRAKGADMTGQDAACSFNTDYEPQEGYPPAINEYDLPVGWVDWCDAFAYCKWAGRRLCGKIGGGGTTEYQNPAVSQWMHACVGPQNKNYPYGNAFIAGNCNTTPAGTADALVASFTKCVGGYPGLYDMSGNVEEWQDSCNGDQCILQGGSWYFGNGDPNGQWERCDAGGAPFRNNRAQEIGFRCCGP